MSFLSTMILFPYGPYSVLLTLRQGLSSVVTEHVSEHGFAHSSVGEAGPVLEPLEPLGPATKKYTTLSTMQDTTTETKRHRLFVQAALHLTLTTHAGVLVGGERSATLVLP